MKLTNFFKDISQDNLQERLSPLVETLINTISEFLELQLVNKRYTFLLTNHTASGFRPDSIFDYGVERSILDNKLEIKIYTNYIEFFPFILLREIYNLFILREIRD
ncbi:hypothetical protein LCGC14_0606500 [marine sediment metagenome]|uniref:Uncharacterized protein n=1 Tax=marine sediment metagenome TaxID=412755 RepID=A0A0F9R913_9ZZZZ|nr:hypothetical protein [bacterium]